MLESVKTRITPNILSPPKNNKHCFANITVFIPEIYDDAQLS